jgi:sterol desaturase/sphingolipid hydroxylase (fatty acid hydroxylase superfamily)
MTKIIAMLAVFTVSVIASVLTLMYGWGLQPKNWWWIIGVGIFFHAFWQIVAQRVMNEDKGK